MLTSSTYTPITSTTMLRSRHRVKTKDSRLREEPLATQCHTTTTGNPSASTDSRGPPQKIARWRPDRPRRLPLLLIALCLLMGAARGTEEITETPETAVPKLYKCAWKHGVRYRKSEDMKDKYDSKRREIIIENSIYPGQYVVGVAVDGQCVKVDEENYLPLTVDRGDALLEKVEFSSLFGKLVKFTRDACQTKDSVLGNLTEVFLAKLARKGTIGRIAKINKAAFTVTVEYKNKEKMDDPKWVGWVRKNVFRQNAYCDFVTKEVDMRRKGNCIMELTEDEGNGLKPWQYNDRCSNCESEASDACAECDGNGYLDGSKLYRAQPEYRPKLKTVGVRTSPVMAALMDESRNTSVSTDLPRVR